VFKKWLRRRQEQRRRLILCVLHTYGAQTVVDLSRRSGFSSSTLYAMLVVMEERGLVLSDWGLPRTEGGSRPRLYIPSDQRQELLVKACPFCRGRATKLVSLSSGVITCQQCGRSYTPAVKPEKKRPPVSVIDAMFSDLLMGVRGLTNERTDCGRMHMAAGVEKLIADIHARVTRPRMVVVCSRACANPRRDKEQEHPGICVCGGFLTDEPEASDAVARPASSKQGLSIRVPKRRDQTGGYASGRHSR
jgi:IclR helix-turn-helix domain